MAEASLASRRGGFLGRAVRHPSLVAGGSLTILLLAIGLVSLAWTPGSPTRIVIRERLLPPGPVHWLGTDLFGRDVASMLMAGAQTSILVGTVAVVLGLLIGCALGLTAAARGGWVDEAIMRLSDFAFAFPAVLLAILLATAFGAGTTNAVLAIGLFNVPVFARLTRGSARAVWTRDYVLAARACGKRGLRITVEHVLPNILAVLLVQATVQFAIAILAEAGLSYLGLGTQPPTPSWGRMLNDSQTLLYQAPRLAVFPGLAIMLSVLGLNLLGDGLRDLLDPRLARLR